MQFFGGSEVSPSPPIPSGAGNRAHMMYVFNRNGVCLLYREWNRPLRTLSSQQDHKLMFGLLFSLKSFTAKMDPSSVEKGNLGVPQLPGQGCSFHSFSTNSYKLSLMETPSGIKEPLLCYLVHWQIPVRKAYGSGYYHRCELFNTALDQYVKNV
ncbi:hypothetical protein C5167_032934 [Papaver somniferum]|uniref:Trafficking protein particle complex subunit n=1 Tax=Papaver somniferum TaxID=3469 RepID=A0A4Y7KBR8_PAPSO|nr:hypothetical protein C5167_032934 [Papaver somniferum]